MSLKIFVLFLKKLLPLMEEVVFKDRSVTEFLYENQLAVFLLTIIIILSLSLVSTRHKLYISRTEPPHTYVNSYKVVPGPIEVKGVEPDPSPNYPRKPIDEDTPTITINRNETYRDLIRDRLLEN